MNKEVIIFGGIYDLEDPKTERMVNEVLRSRFKCNEIQFEHEKVTNNSYALRFFRELGGWFNPEYERVHMLDIDLLKGQDGSWE